jgi:hypothetical protein
MFDRARKRIPGSGAVLGGTLIVPVDDALTMRLK